MPKAGFSDSLGSLRGIAALAVVIYHSLKVFQVGSYDDPYIISLSWGDGWLFLSQMQLILFNGRSAVTLFFVLSGAVLTISLLRGEKFGKLELVAYYVRRGFRLYPLLVFVTLSAAALHIFYFTPGEQSAMTNWAARRYQHSPGVWEVFTNTIGYRHTLNPPSWTIYIEVVASILFPLFFLSVMSQRSTVIMGTVLLAILFLPSHPFLQQAGRFMICFFIGALIPIYGEPAARLFLSWAPLARTITTLGVASLLLSFNQIYQPAIEANPVRILVETCCAAFIVCIAYYGTPLKFLRSRTCQYLGEISYSVYLIHFGILFILAHLIAPVAGAQMEPISALCMNALLAVATIAVTLPIASVTHYMIEKPFQNFGRWVGGQVTGQLWLRKSARSAVRPVIN
jgi:peptidoglycan/LPS O-acetylase OafA/YrhL